MQPEAIWLILAVDEVDEVLSLIFMGSVTTRRGIKTEAIVRTM
jgi:hypothetical protein